MHLVRRRGLQRVLLVLSLIVGVVAMHSTTACHDATGHARNAAVHVDDSAHSAPSPAARSAMDGEMPAAGPAPAAGVAGEREPAGQHSALHDLLHLCLAVVAALLVLAGTALLTLLAGSAARRAGDPRGGRPGTGPRAPPPTSVRLAQLCVLRN